MSFHQNFTKEFSKAIRDRGDVYYHSGLVTIVRDSAHELNALVRGTRTYGVTLFWLDAKSVVAECSCPYFNQSSFCKHIWATLVAIGEDGSAFTAGLNPKQSVTLCDAQILDQDDEGFIGDELYQPFEQVQPLDQDHFGPPTAQQPPISSRNWREYLSQMKRLQAAAPPSIQDLLTPTTSVLIHYILSAPNDDILCVSFYQLETSGEEKKLTSITIADNPDTWRFTAEDRQLLLRLWVSNRQPAAAEWEPDGSPHGVNAEDATPYFLLDSLGSEDLLAALTRTGRCYWVNDDDGGLEQAKVLHWDGDQTWKFALDLQHNGPGGGRPGYSLRGFLHRGSATVDLKDLSCLQFGGVGVYEDRLLRIDDANGAFFQWMKLLYQTGQLDIYARDVDAFISDFYELAETPSLTWPENFPWRWEDHYDPVPRMVIRNLAETGSPKNRDLRANLWFDYGPGASFQLRDNRTKEAVVEDHTVIPRQHDKEVAYLKQLTEHGISFADNRDWDMTFAWDRLKDLCQEFSQRGWVVEAEGRQLRAARTLNGHVASSGIDWFDVTVQADFAGNVVGLPRLLRASAEGQNLILLDDGSFGLLPEEWLQRFGPLARLGKQDPNGADKIRLQKSQGLFLNPLAEEFDFTVDRNFAKLREQIKSFNGIQPQHPTRGFQGELRDYQRDGLAWLHFLRDFGFGGCLADDMGLGKTVQVLALLHDYKQKLRAENRRPSLVVVPKTLMYNWQQEAKTFTPRLKVALYEGSRRDELLEDLASYDFVLMTYGILRQDIALLADYTFAYVILDEAQAIKNFQAQTAQASRHIQAEHRLVLSGTPVENHLGELGSLFEFLNPGMFGSKGVKELGRLRKSEQLTPLIQGLKPLILRRTKEQVLTELPGKVEQTLYCELTGRQRKDYHQMRDFFRESLKEKVADQGLERSSMHVLQALMRLRQAACHPGLIDPKRAGASSSKLDLLCHQIEELTEQGHKALVFSQFTKLLAIVRAQLDKRGISYEYLDGRTRKREDKVARFQTDESCQVFLISLKAGGVGLNLTAADYCFILDPWWNPAVEMQAVDRIHRIGQKNQVFAYRVIAKDTVEEKIIELQKQKKELSDAIITADGGFLRSMTADDLEMLLS